MRPPPARSVGEGSRITGYIAKAPCNDDKQADAWNVCVTVGHGLTANLNNSDHWDKRYDKESTSPSTR